MSRGKRADRKQVTAKTASEIDPRVFEATEVYHRASSTRTLRFVEEAHRSLIPRSQVELRLIAAMALYDSGQITRGLADLAATDEKTLEFDLDLQFRSAFSLFSRSCEFETQQDLMPLLSRLRQIATQKGDGVSLAGLQLALAKVEACRGNSVSASVHLETARA